MSQFPAQFDPVAIPGEFLRQCQPVGGTVVPDDTLSWNPDRCDTAFSGPFIRNMDPVDQTSPLWRAGDTDVINVLPTRMASPAPERNEENCTYAVGFMALDVLGHPQSLTCNRNRLGDDTVSVGLPFVMTQAVADDFPGRFEVGATYFVGGYQTPEPTEMHLFSRKHRCVEIL